MQSTPEDLYYHLSDIMPKDQFLQEINYQYTLWDKLINKHLIALYLIDKHGRNTRAYTTIHDMQPNQEYTITATISNMQNERTFTRKNGNTGRVLNLDIQDTTGTCRLVLWNDDVDLINQHNITIGTTIKIINGYTKNSRNGIEIHLGKWGLLEIQTTQQQPIQSPNTQEITGELVEREPSRPFFKDNGDFGFITKIILKIAKKRQEIILWNEKVKEIQQFNIGDTITLEQFSTKCTNGSEEIHLNGNSIIRKS